MVRPSSEVFLEDALDRRNANRGEGHSELKRFWLARECKSAYVPFPPLLRVKLWADGVQCMSRLRPRVAEPPAVSYLHYEIDDELHRRLKVLAASRGVTLKALVVELLERAVDQAESPAKKPKPRPKR